MAKKCVRCTKVINRKDISLKCGGECEEWWHPSCAQLQDDDLTTLTRRGVVWICPICLPATGRTSIVDPQHDADEIIRESDPDTGSPNTMLLTMMRNEIRKTIKAEIEILKTSVQHFSDKIDDFETTFKKMEEHQRNMEKKIMSLIDKDKNLELKYEALNQRVTELEQKLIEKNVEIFGLDKENINENLQEVVKKIAVQLKVPDTAIAAMQSVHRAGPNRPQEAGQRPRPVVVELSSRKAKDDWIEAAKAVSTITNHDVYNNGKGGVIRVREQLTTNCKQLLWDTKEKLRHSFKYIWCKGGKIMIRKQDEDKLFYIKTFHDISKHVAIDLSSEDWLRHSGWEPSHETVFIVHGYAGGDDLLPIIVLRDAYLRRGTYNVIMMDWGSLARAPCYVAAVHNLRGAARCAAAALAVLRRAGLRPERFVCVGHSLGAHLCGIISNYLTFRMYRIIGLDPARPLIRAAPALRLDAGDARAVHVLHTNAGKYGEAARLGTADFCLNGGRNQPFCYDTPNEALCSHIWSICYQAESIFRSRMAEPCGRRCTARPTRARAVGVRAALPVPLGQRAPMAATGAYCIEDTLPPFCPAHAGGDGDERCCLDKQYAAAAALHSTTRPLVRLRQARRRTHEALYDSSSALQRAISNNRLD